jgi:hypothetical protein
LGIWVADHLLYLSQPNVVVDPALDLHIEILVYGVDDVLLKAYSTDTTLEGTRYQATDVFYETDKITGWDQESGLVQLSVALLPSQEYWVGYHYESRDYEVPVELNPIFNKKSLGLTYVYYLVPDQTETALFWLAIRPDGTIQDCSQPEFKLLDPVGNWNPDTLIGSKYWDETDDSFLSTYCVGWDNEYQYYVLAEYAVLENDLVENVFAVPVDRAGGIDPDAFSEVVLRNPRLLQSRWGYGELGQEIPKNNVVVVRVPLSKTIEYGGDLTTDQIEALLQEHMTVGVAMVIDWVYPKAELSGYSTTPGTVELAATWEGPGLTYTLYRRAGPQDVWIAIDTSTPMVEGTVVFTDTRTSGDVWWYAVRVTKDSVEYPVSNQLGVRVA